MRPDSNVRVAAYGAWRVVAFVGKAFSADGVLDLERRDSNPGGTSAGYLLFELKLEGDEEATNARGRGREPPAEPARLDGAEAARFANGPRFSRRAIVHLNTGLFRRSDARTTLHGPFLVQGAYGNDKL
jgi:hypothetical protein